jgi:hypothetical protein
MSTATAINLEDMTTGEAKLTLDKVIKQIATNDTFVIDNAKDISEANYDYSTVISREDLTIIAYALENNLQLRDYLMGLTRDGLSVESVTGIVRVLSALVKCAELPAYPIETVLASYMYRLGDSAGALVMLANGISRDYPLAKLLLRIFNAGLAPDIFATMSQELHGKVVEELTRTQELPANEANR